MLQKVTKNSLVDTIKSNTTKQGPKSASKAQSFPISTAGTADFEAQSSVKTFFKKKCKNYFGLRKKLFIFAYKKLRMSN